MPVDQAKLVRALRRSVFTYKHMSMDQAYRYCDLVGLPRSVLYEGEPDSSRGRDERT